MQEPIAAPLLTGVIEQIGDGIAVVDNDGRFVLVNPAFAALHGCSSQDLLSQPLTVFCEALAAATPGQQLLVNTSTCGVTRAELLCCRRDGSAFPAWLTVSLLRDDNGDVVGRVLSVQDMTDRKHAEDQLRRQALHDPLTGLPNRRLLLDRLTHALNRAVRHEHLVAVLFLDLDGFKTVNDQLSHAAGDQLLVEIASRLSSCLRPEDTLARLGGDEFAVLLDQVVNPVEPVEVAERLRAALNHVSNTGHSATHITASIGVALSNRGTAEDLLHSADTHMYRAKRNGKDQVAFRMEDS